MLRRRYLAPLSFSRFKNGCAAHVNSGTEKGERESVPPPLRFIPLP